MPVVAEQRTTRETNTIKGKKPQSPEAARRTKKNRERLRKREGEEEKKEEGKKERKRHETWIQENA